MITIKHESQNYVDRYYNNEEVICEVINPPFSPSIDETVILAGKYYRVFDVTHDVTLFVKGIHLETRG